MTEAEKVLPCPWCGDSHSIRITHGAGFYRVVCRNCDAIGPGHSSMTKDVAIKQWNRRAGQKEEQ